MASKLSSVLTDDLTEDESTEDESTLSEQKDNNKNLQNIHNIRRRERSVSSSDNNGRSSRRRIETASTEDAIESISNSKDPDARIVAVALTHSVETIIDDEEKEEEDGMEEGEYKYNVEVYNTGTMGMGLRAKRFLKRDTVVAKFREQENVGTLTKEAQNTLAKTKDCPHDAMIEMNGKTYIDTTFPKNKDPDKEKKIPIWYRMNHDKHPNVRWYLESGILVARVSPFKGVKKK